MKTDKFRVVVFNGREENKRQALVKPPLLQEELFVKRSNNLSWSVLVVISTTFVDSTVPLTVWLTGVLIETS